MEEKFSPIVRVDDQNALRMIRALAAEDKRSIGNEIAVLIQREYNRRFQAAETRTRPELEAQLDGMTEPRF